MHALVFSLHLIKDPRLYISKRVIGSQVAELPIHALVFSNHSIHLIKDPRLSLSSKGREGFHLFGTYTSCIMGGPGP